MTDTAHDTEHARYIAANLRAQGQEDAEKAKQNGAGPAGARKKWLRKANERIGIKGGARIVRVVEHREGAEATYDLHFANKVVVHGIGADVMFNPRRMAPLIAQAVRRPFDYLGPKDWQEVAAALVAAAVRGNPGTSREEQAREQLAAWAEDEGFGGLGGFKVEGDLPRIDYDDKETLYRALENNVPGLHLVEHGESRFHVRVVHYHRWRRHPHGGGQVGLSRKDVEDDLYLLGFRRRPSAESKLAARWNEDKKSVTKSRSGFWLSPPGFDPLPSKDDDPEAGVSAL